MLDAHPDTVRPYQQHSSVWTTARLAHLFRVRMDGADWDECADEISAMMPCEDLDLAPEAGACRKAFARYYPGFYQPRRQKRWTEEDEARLLTWWVDGVPATVIGTRLGRTAVACTDRISVMRTRGVPVPFQRVRFEERNKRVWKLVMEQGSTYSEAACALGVTRGVVAGAIRLERERRNMRGEVR